MKLCLYCWTHATRAMRPHMPTEPRAPARSSVRSARLVQTERQRELLDRERVPQKVEMMLRAGKGGHRSAAVLQEAYERRLVATPPRSRPRTTGSVRALHLRAASLLPLT